MLLKKIYSLDLELNYHNSLSNFSDYWRWNVNYGASSGCEGIQPTPDIVTFNSYLDSANSDCGTAVSYKNIGGYTSYSRQGAKCKIEIISKTDLLRARGYKEQ